MFQLDPSLITFYVMYVCTHIYDWCKFLKFVTLDSDYSNYYSRDETNYPRKILFFFYNATIKKAVILIGHFHSSLCK